MSLSVDWCDDCGPLFRFYPSPMHPVRQMNHGRTAPYWGLGAAQLEAGRTCPVRSEDLSHHLEHPLAPTLYANQAMVYHQWLLLVYHQWPCWCHSSDTILEWPLQSVGLGYVYKRSCWPGDGSPPLLISNRIQGKGSADSLAAGDDAVAAGMG